MSVSDFMRLIGHDGRVTPPRTRLSLYLLTATVSRARAFVAGVKGTQHQVSLNELFDSALRRELTRREKEANGGQPFPAVDEIPGAGGDRSRPA